MTLCLTNNLENKSQNNEVCYFVHWFEKTYYKLLIISVDKRFLTGIQID